ncbi:hypothetical protein SPRG_12803 [Saprolegnia parasitica CBS 223.65]|uniref:glucan endo-1,3-beta-D-glucosidase n=1 Tax=Saprolegnia parasitica (strain CBS 223.65) TaxID=695850 RepID=A0A067C6B1_SAPPC|nr:hypothetical protein SPRG_12803 [Saprolegnia parasitica CBS 223.65]KDO22342.1 hypothetical protein SPRG_12803 [Saprolegnia parasitica CBS 223.65]|eukprot:XP_012206976.1 hypothetical protein SPRG_12803 [Saprolegnia parasitica CBS 223.65]
MLPRAVLSVLCLAAAALGAPRGVCYDAYNSDSASTHFASIASRFDAVRTYQTWTHNSNLIDIAARNGLAMYPGIWLRGNGRNPGTVKAVFVGNEDLSNNWNAGAVLDKINQAKGAFRDAGLGYVRIGTVQTDGDWLHNAWLADHVDVVGVNIYPFFGSHPDSWNNPVKDLDARWTAMTNRFGNKVLLTETGWPDAGGNVGAHVANWQNAQNYFRSAQAWMDGNKGGELPTYFMYHDNRGKPSYEGHFALAEPNGQWKFEFNAKKNPPNNNGGNNNNDGDKPSGQFQLITSRGKALREWYGGLAAKDNNNDAFTKWTYDANAQTLKNEGANKCLDAYMDGNNVKVHLYHCDGNNSNQKWRLAGGKVIHARFSNVCLDADANDPNEGVQNWACVDNNSNQVFKISTGGSGNGGRVALTVRSFNRVFAVGSNDQVLFRSPQGSIQSDTNALWTLDGKGLLKSAANGKCLDAWEAKNGGGVHSWNCDENNANQKWSYDTNTKQLRHAKHSGYCLDMGSENGDRPQLWQCHPANDYWAKFQQFAQES